MTKGYKPVSFEPYSPRVWIFVCESLPTLRTSVKFWVRGCEGARVRLIYTTTNSHPLYILQLTRTLAPKTSHSSLRGWKYIPQCTNFKCTKMERPSHIRRNLIKVMVSTIQVCPVGTPSQRLPPPANMPIYATFLQDGLPIFNNGFETNNYLKCLLFIS